MQLLIPKAVFYELSRQKGKSGADGFEALPKKARAGQLHHDEKLDMFFDDDAVCGKGRSSSRRVEKLQARGGSPEARGAAPKLGAQPRAPEALGGRGRRPRHRKCSGAGAKEEPEKGPDGVLL